MPSKKEYQEPRNSRSTKSNSRPRVTPTNSVPLRKTPTAPVTIIPDAVKPKKDKGTTQVRLWERPDISALYSRFHQPNKNDGSQTA
jgi:hypothetical protein